MLSLWKGIHCARTRDLFLEQVNTTEANMLWPSRTWVRYSERKTKKKHLVTHICEGFPRRRTQGPGSFLELHLHLLRTWNN